jgi:predicted peroxiredoxin
MAQYLLFASKSPWETDGAGKAFRLARDLSAAGHEVTLYLVQNGVLAARAGAAETGLAEVTGSASVLADDFSLRERAIPADGLRAGVRPAPIDSAVEQIARGVRAIWM